MQKFISSSVFKNFKDSVELAKELNTNLEISRFANNLDDIDETFNIRIEQMKKDLHGFKGELSLHAFLFDLCVVSQDPLIKKVSRQRFEQSLWAAEYLGAKTVVYHTGFIADLKHNLYRMLYKQNLIKYLKDFIEKFEDSGIVMVLENVQEKSPEFILDVIKGVNSPNLRASIDIGHANIHSDVAVMDWIKQYNKFLYHMHIHNNYGDDDSHNSLLKGTINIEGVFRTIKDLNLNPKIIFEIFDKDEVIESIEYFDKFFDQEQIEKTEKIK